MNETRLRVPATQEGVTRVATAFDAFAAALALPESVASASSTGRTMSCSIPSGVEPG